MPASTCHDIVDLINKYPLLFSDHLCRTSVLNHDIEVEGDGPITPHAYRVNPIKRAAMQQEVEYFMCIFEGVSSCVLIVLFLSFVALQRS